MIVLPALHLRSPDDPPNDGDQNQQEDEVHRAGGSSASKGRVGTAPLKLKSPSDIESNTAQVQAV